jgi:metallo-beta-lactamase class B
MISSLLRAPVLVIGAALAIAPAVLAADSDSPAVKEHIDKAVKIAGKEWAAQEKFFCEMPVANLATDPLLTPMKIFDNVYILGSISTTIYAFNTSEGLVLIDAGYPNQADTVLLPQLKKLGLDESKIKYVFLGHGHVDHYGASKYLQDKYGTHIVLSDADWDLVDPPASSGKKARDDAPKRDIVIKDGQTMTIGDFHIAALLLPGHTPGTLGYIFPVKDGKKTYTAGMFGGNVLLPRIAYSLDEYVKSLEKWEAAAKKYKIDVQLQNHPHMLGITEKLDKLQSRKPGEVNPFVVPTATYARYFQVIEECTLAQKQRILENPTPPKKEK